MQLKKKAISQIEDSSTQYFLDRESPNLLPAP